MAEPTATAYFYYQVQYRLVICKECRHAVWPDQVEGHLQGKHHRVGRKQAELIGNEVRDWHGLITSPSELEVPVQVGQPIAELPLHEDGLLCRLEPGKCRYIYRNKKGIKNHWSREHSWSTLSRKGRSGKSKEDTAERRFQEAARPVRCQRFFPSRHGSQYFEVCQPEPEPEPEQTQEDQAHSAQGGGGGGEQLWRQAWDKANKSWEELEERARATIEDGEKDEVSPWLDRTQWLPYLARLNRDELLASIEEPNAGTDPDRPPEEPVAAAIWKAMEEVARVSQASTAERVGIFVRMELMRTEKHQNRYHPLQPYTEEDSIIKRSGAWKQVLMFFIRTQQEHDWRSPEYKFTRRQFEAFTRLVEEAELVANREEGSEEERSNRGGGGGEEEGEEEEEEEESSSQGEAGPKRLPKLSEIQKACLDFCIELLNQRITQREYDSALVCALAVQGVTPTGWREPGLYTTILSAIIKVGRFMVVQKALEMAGPAAAAAAAGAAAGGEEGGGWGEVQQWGQRMGL